MSRTYGEVIEAREKELDQFRGKYQAAKALTAGRDSKDVIEIHRLLRAYIAGDSPEKAVYIVAQAAMLADKMAEPFLIIEAYDNKVKSLDAMKQQLNPEVTG
jgi:hypothetical protein